MLLNTGTNGSKFRCWFRISDQRNWDSDFEVGFLLDKFGPHTRSWLHTTLCCNISEYEKISTRSNWCVIFIHDSAGICDCIFSLLLCPPVWWLSASGNFSLFSLCSVVFPAFCRLYSHKYARTTDFVVMALRTHTYSNASSSCYSNYQASYRFHHTTYALFVTFPDSYLFLVLY